MLMPRAGACAGCPSASLRRARPLLAAVAVVSSLAVAGCGGGQKTHSTSGTGKVTSTTKTTAFTPPKPITTFTDTTLGGNGPIPFQVSVYDLRRDGSFLVLDLGVRCLLPANPGCGTLDAFSPGYRPTSSIQYDEGSLDGIWLLDPTNLKAYLPVRDAQLRPFASALAPGSTGFTDSLVHLEWVRYPLPAAGVSALDVTFPQGGPVIRDVPISNGPGPTAGGQYQAAQPSAFAQSTASASTAGLTLPVENLTSISGNPTGSDSESPGRAQITLQSDVLFKFDKSNLTPKAQTVLRAVAQQIKARARGTVQVTGYTDSIGSDAVNIPLSQARARSVVAALTPLTSGITYTSQGLGSADPVAPNTLPGGADNPAGRALNRRVTIVFSATATRPTPPAPAPATGSAAPQTTSMTFTEEGGSETYGASSPALYRDGDLLILTMHVSCVSASSANDCVVLNDLAGTATVPPQPEVNTAINTTMSGFYLVDPTTGTTSIPVVRSDTVPATSSLAESIKTGDGYQVWAYFPAPPAATTSLTLVSPGGASRLGPIPISGAASTTP
jgi:outer membrane protein OmpA-like peptidoglycan-associated protein